MGADTKGGISLRQKKRFTEHEWILLEEKFNDLLPPILGYAEFLQMQLGPESELSQDAHEIELAAGQLQALFQEIFSHHGPVGGKDRAATNVRQGDLPSNLPEKFGER